MNNPTPLFRVLAIFALTALTACTSHPPGEREERRIRDHHRQTLRATRG